MPFIGATQVWNNLGVRGQGMKVAVVDTGIDYTHANFGGPGTVAAYEANDPNFIEPGTFPTNKVIGGYDFVGSDYDVLDEDPTNDIRAPTPTRSTGDDHGSHTGGTVAGIGVPGRSARESRPRRSCRDQGLGRGQLHRRRAGRRLRAGDGPERRRQLSDGADVLSFSGGVDYGT